MVSAMSESLPCSLAKSHSLVDAGGNDSTASISAGSVWGSLKGSVSITATLQPLVCFVVFKTWLASATVSVSRFPPCGLRESASAPIFSFPAQ